MLRGGDRVVHTQSDLHGVVVGHSAIAGAVVVRWDCKRPRGGNVVRERELKRERKKQRE